MNKLKDIKKLFKKPFIPTAIAVIVVYFAIRLINLDLIPVFVDEAIYVRWAQVMRNEPTLRFLPLSEGKQPLFMWILMFILQLFSDPLVAGRVVSVAAGFVTLLGVAFLTWLVTKSRLATLISSVFYIILPYTFFFDRMALVDSMLAAFAVWSIILGLLLVDTPRLDLSLLLGFVLGGALLTKSPSIFFILLQPVFLLSTKLNKQKIIKIIGSWLVAGLVAFMFYNIMRLGPNFHLINSRNQDYLFSFSEVLQHPLNPLTGNLKSTFAWLGALFGWPVFALVFAAMFSKNRSLKVIFLWSLLPLLAQASVAKVYTPRYLLFAAVPLLVLAASSISKLVKSLPKAGLILLAVAMLWPAITTFNLLTQPANAALPQRMRHGYFQEWTAGYGQEDIAQYIKTKAQEGDSILIGTEGFFGTLPDGLQIYLQDVPNVTVIGLSYPVSEISQSLSSALEENLVYLVVNKSRNKLTPQHLERLELIDQYPKPPRPDGTREVLQFYQLLE